MKNGITHDNLGMDIHAVFDEVLEKADEVYICPSFGCNLNCPHCTLKNIRNEGDIDAIVNSIKWVKKFSPNVSFTLFGGEPSLLKDDTLTKIREAIGESSYSISTNLIKFNDTFLQMLKEADLPDTSWNPQRFHTQELYKQWLDNLQVLKDNNITFELMITLTKDLIEEFTPQQFIDKVLEWDVKYVKLEFMIGDDTLNPEEVDDWLVKLYDIWNTDERMKDYNNILFQRLIDVANKNIRWEGNCEHTITILPSGNIKERCPYYEISVIKNCLSCEYYEYCQGGCPLQDKCVFPKQLFDRIKKDLNV